MTLRRRIGRTFVLHATTLLEPQHRTQRPVQRLSARVFGFGSVHGSLSRAYVPAGPHDRSTLLVDGLGKRGFCFLG